MSIKNKQNAEKSNQILVFFYKYWITAVLLLVLLSLIRQNFINQFPFGLMNKQQIIKQNISRNQTLKQQNKISSIELNTQTASDNEVLESQARYRFGLIKKGETYYQINELTPNEADQP